MKKDTPSSLCDVGQWLYNDTVKDHFFNPRNILLDEKDYVADGIGITGSPLCGDMMVVWIKINKETKQYTSVSGVRLAVLQQLHQHR